MKLHPKLREYSNGEVVAIPAHLLPCDTSVYPNAREGYGYVDIGDGWDENADPVMVDKLVELLQHFAGSIVYNTYTKGWCIEVKPQHIDKVQKLYDKYVGVENGERVS